jgi:hypothetical protein
MIDSVDREETAGKTGCPTVTDGAKWGGRSRRLPFGQD